MARLLFDEGEQHQPQISRTKDTAPAPAATAETATAEALAATVMAPVSRDHIGAAPALAFAATAAAAAMHEVAEMTV
jgi:hypothetical protein